MTHDRKADLVQISQFVLFLEAAIYVLKCNCVLY